MSVRQPYPVSSGGITIGDAIGSGTSGSILFVDASGNLAQDNANLFWDDTGNSILLGGTTAAGADTILGANGSFIFNEQAADVDSRIEGIVDPYLFYTDAGNDRVGIGTNAPSYKLTVVGVAGMEYCLVNASSGNPAVEIRKTSNAPSAINFNGSYIHVGGSEFLDDSYRIITFGYQHSGLTYFPAYIGYQEKSTSSQTKGDLIFGTRDVVTDSQPTERMRISSAGNVLINGFAADVIGLTVKGAVSHTANLQEWQNSAGTVLGAFNPDSAVDGIARLYVGNGTPEASAVLTAAATTENTVAVYGAGSAYFMGRDVTNNIEFIMGTSSVSSLSFVGSMTNHALELRTNNAERFRITNGGSGVWNDLGGAVTLRFEGDADANLLYLDGVNDRVGIGTASPATKLDVNGTGNFVGDVTVPDEVYGAGWNGSLEVPTKNAAYDKIETLAPIASPTFTGTVTLPTTSAGGVITLAENTSLALDPAGSADGKYSGITVAGTAGATLAFGDLIYLAAADSRWELADATDASTSGDVMLGICVLAAAADASPTVVLLKGIIRADAAFPNLTISAQVYASTDAGDVQVAQPSGTDEVIRVVGRGLTINEMYFNPSENYVTHV